MLERNLGTLQLIVKDSVIHTCAGDYMLCQTAAETCYVFDVPWHIPGDCFDRFWTRCALHLDTEAHDYSHL